MAADGESVGPTREVSLSPSPVLVESEQPPAIINLDLPEAIDDKTQDSEGFPPESGVDALLTDAFIIDDQNVPPLAPNQLFNSQLNQSNAQQTTALLQLKEIEKESKILAQKLEQMLESLKSNLTAMATCTNQSITVHKDTALSLHKVVDASVKSSYSLLSQFNELHDNLKPIHDLYSQIQQLNEQLKILEKLF